MTIENSVFDTFDITPIIITGKGRVNLDLGGGSQGSAGNNSFIPAEGELIINEDGADVEISYPEKIYLQEETSVTDLAEDKINLTESAIQMEVSILEFLQKILNLSLGV